MEQKWLFLCFLLIAAGQDLHKKSVAVWVYLLFGGLALASRSCQLFVAGLSQWGDLLCGVCPGLAMLGVSMLWQEDVGVGDGCFFLVSGLMLGFWQNLALLCYGLFLCSGYCLVKLVWNQILIRKNVGRETVPFLPFLVPVGIWLFYAK